MSYPSVHAVLAGAFFIFASAASPAIGQTRSTTTAGDDARMQAERIASSIVLDGVLDEEVWQQAAPISDFRQSEPIDGAPASRRTEVRVV